MIEILLLFFFQKLEVFKRVFFICPIYIWVNQNKDLKKVYSVCLMHIWVNLNIDFLKKYFLCLMHIWVNLNKYFFWKYSICLIHRGNLNKAKVETLRINTSLFLLSHTFMLWKLLEISKPVTYLNQLNLLVFFLNHWILSQME